MWLAGTKARTHRARMSRTATTASSPARRETSSAPPPSPNPIISILSGYNELKLKDRPPELMPPTPPTTVARIYRNPRVDDQGQHFVSAAFSLPSTYGQKYTRINAVHRGSRRSKLAHALRPHQPPFLPMYFLPQQAPPPGSLHGRLQLCSWLRAQAHLIPLFI